MFTSENLDLCLSNRHLCKAWQMWGGPGAISSNLELRDKQAGLVLISHVSKVMLKILQARLQQYVNQELPDVQARFRKGRGTRDQIASTCWILEKARELKKNLLMLYWLHKKSLCTSQQMWKILKEMGIPDHLTCLLRNLCAGQEATVKTLHEQLTGSKLGKEYNKAEYCHSVYLTYMQSTSCVHHWFNGHEFGETLGDGEAQGILVCCSTWDCKELDMTWRLNNNSIMQNTGLMNHKL